MDMDSTHERRPTMTSAKTPAPARTLPALIALLAAATLSGAALADESPRSFEHEHVGTPKTRAEVIAELREAQASGEFERLHADEPAAVRVRPAAKARSTAGSTPTLR